MRSLPQDVPSAKSRRAFLLTGLLGFIGAVFGRKALAADETPPPSPLVTEGEVLKTSVFKGRPPIEPLDTMIRFERSDENNGPPITHQILSLIHEEKGQRSFPWTIYSHLTTQHVEGDACVLCSRLTKNGAGWSAGLHSEVFNSARAVGIGVNVEMSNHYAGPDPSWLIGVNIQTLGPQQCQYGMQIHGKGRHEKGIGLNGKGDTGLDVAGEYGVGIHLHKNDLRMDEGTSISLDGEGKVKIRLKDGRIEFLNGEKCVGHLDLNGEDHAM